MRGTDGNRNEYLLEQRTQINVLLRVGCDVYPIRYNGRVSMIMILVLNKL